MATIRIKFFLLSFMALSSILGGALFIPSLLYALIPVAPLILLGIYDVFQNRHTLLKNFPVIGHFRYLLLSIRPEIHQYFVEGNSDGAPFTYEKRAIIYQRAKRTLDTLPFGTRLDVDRIGYEWINHSLSAAEVKEEEMRITIGGSDCSKPYSASIFNISAMSFGALSRNAILALNKGACIGEFAHNTGEGGISPYHEDPGGDLIWQIGTGYFGCRHADGGFSEREFQSKATRSQVKMIEIKLSQGAKPGKGGILPGPKVSPEISAIRGVSPYQTVYSPPNHSTFETPIGLMEFIERLRGLSGGKPVGFKLCLGKRREFFALCKAMIKTGIFPDFISVDGAEGGTGSAPVEFSNSVGTPMTEGIIEVENTLIGFGIRDRIKIIAAGKISTGFHIARAVSLGADLCYSARAFMLALGCIQALKCNTDECPTGVATQKPSLHKGLVVKDKSLRVAHFHRETIQSLKELISACGIESPGGLKRWHILKRIHINQIKNFEELFPHPPKGSFLDKNIPAPYLRVLAHSSADSFHS